MGKCRERQKNMAFNGQRMLQLRERLNMTQEELADRLQTSQAKISRYESNLMIPGADKLILMAQTLSTSADYLLELTDDPQPCDKRISYKHPPRHATSPTIV